MLSALFQWYALFTQSSPSALLTSALFTIALGLAWLAFALRHRPTGALPSQRELIQLHFMVDRLRAELREAHSNGDSADHLLSALNRIRLQLPPDDLRR